MEAYRFGEWNIRVVDQLGIARSFVVVGCIFMQDGFRRDQVLKFFRAVEVRTRLKKVHSMTSENC